MRTEQNTLFCTLSSVITPPSLPKKKKKKKEKSYRKCRTKPAGRPSIIRVTAVLPRAQFETVTMETHFVPCKRLIYPVKTARGLSHLIVYECFLRLTGGGRHSRAKRFHGPMTTLFFPLDQSLCFCLFLSNNQDFM